jgi:hypothetical protein
MEKGVEMQNRKVVLLLALFGILLAGCRRSNFYYNCQTAEQIDTKAKSEITDLGMQFLRAVLEGDSATVFSHLSEDAKKNTSRDQLDKMFQPIKLSGPFDKFHVERLITVTGHGHLQQGTSVAVCAQDTNFTENNVRVTILDQPTQAYVLVASTGSKESWILSLWLTPSLKTWQIQSFQITADTLGGKDASNILSWARMENSRGHKLNASILYAVATNVASRGPFYRTALEDEIQREARTVSIPKEFQGNPPFALQAGGEEFYLLGVNPVNERGKLYLVLTHQVAPWKDFRKIDQSNNLLIKTFARRFPEYSDVFAGLIAEARGSGGKNIRRTTSENAIINRN